MTISSLPFWKTKAPAEMSSDEWESLCDGCGRCCLVKLEEEGSKVVEYTRVACRLLDIGACRCMDYPNRAEKVPGCVILNPENIDVLDWMPSTCAYRLVIEGRDLKWWHPLVSGDPESVHQAGISVRGRVVKEERVEECDLPDYITHQFD